MRCASEVFPSPGGRRPVEKQVVERLAAALRGGHHQLQVLLDPLLSDVLRERARPQRLIEDALRLLGSTGHGTRSPLHRRTPRSASVMTS
jgi:hypothetical protein